jgi:hypothetical protein
MWNSNIENENVSRVSRIIDAEWDKLAALAYLCYEQTGRGAIHLSGPALTSGAVKATEEGLVITARWSPRREWENHPSVMNAINKYDPTTQVIFVYVQPGFDNHIIRGKTGPDKQTPQQAFANGTGADFKSVEKENGTCYLIPVVGS